MNIMYINVIHRADGDESCLEALRFQQDEAHRCGMSTTILMTAGALENRAVVEYVTEQKESFGDDVGLHFHGWRSPVTEAATACREYALYLHPRESKEKVYNALFERYRALFGTLPTAIGAYIITAPELRFLAAHYPQVKCAIVNCFEEGVKMFEGNNRSWYLFSDGGPWGPYYPSRYNNLCPAQAPGDDVGIVGLPHLSRDMILAITSRDDYFASHPVNIVRAKANDGPRSPYIRRFIDQWIRQAEYNGFSYYNLFVSTPWLLPGSPYSSSVKDARALYTDSLECLRTRIASGKARAVTMTEFAAWYRRLIPVGTSDVNLWDDILCGTKRQMFWYVDGWFRMAVDMNSGGSICDLRSYAGRLERDLGPETCFLWNGNYPFEIATEHRPESCHTCQVSVNGRTASIGDRRTKAMVRREPSGAVALTVDPLTLKPGDVCLTLQSTMRFEGNGRVEITRQVTDCSDPDAVVEITELHRGSYGTTQYPEDMRGIELTADAGNGCREKIVYAYGGESRTVEGARRVCADIEALRTRISLHVSGDIESGTITEGSLFHPFYQISLKKKTGKGGYLKSWLQMEKR